MSQIGKYLDAFSQLSRAARFYRTSIWYQAARSKRLHDRSLFSLKDTLFWGLTDPGIAEQDIDNFMSREARTRLQARVNDRASGPDVDDKARFYELCAASGLAIPETLGILQSDSRVPKASTSNMAAVDFSGLPDGDFVAKPLWGMKGKGILFFSKHGDGYLVEDSRVDESGIRAISNEYLSKDNLVVQRRLIAHPELAAVSVTDAVQSVRIVTYLDSDLKPHILFARFKFIRRGNSMDNFSDGDTGNLIADVDIDSGRVLKTLRKNIGEFGLQVVDIHPDSEMPLNIVLPDWDAAVELAIRGALTFNKLRVLAWDIALTPEGPVILEANQDWEIFPIAPYRKPSPVGDWESLVH